VQQFYKAWAQELGLTLATPTTTPAGTHAGSGPTGMAVDTETEFLADVEATYAETSSAAGANAPDRK
jgi:hypothetical protein